MSDELPNIEWREVEGEGECKQVWEGYIDDRLVAVKVRGCDFWDDAVVAIDPDGVMHQKCKFQYGESTKAWIHHIVAGLEPPHFPTKKEDD